MTAAVGAQAHFEAELAAGRFLIQHCRACDRHVFYPRQVCSHCGAADSLAWKAPGGGGAVYAVTTVHIGVPAPVDVCLVDLDEGVRLMSVVRDVAPGALRIGQRVRAAVAREAPGQPPRVVFDVDTGIDGAAAARGTTFGKTFGHDAAALPVDASADPGAPR